MASVEQKNTEEIQPEEVVNTVVEDGARLGVRRFFTIPGRDPFDEIEWEIRDAVIPGRNDPARRLTALTLFALCVKALNDTIAGTRSEAYVWHDIARNPRSGEPRRVCPHPK